MAPVIEILPLEGGFAFVPRPLATSSVDTAVNFMTGRYYIMWQLRVNSRVYPWPPGGRTKDDPMYDYNTLQDHLEHCIAIDEAFYG